MERNEMKRAAEQFGTPTYVFDLDILAEKLEMIQKHLGGVAELCYAMKANPFLVRAMLPHVEKFEVCSPGEARICSRSHIPMDRVVLSGVYKEESDMRKVLEEDALPTFTIESMAQFQLLYKLAREYTTEEKPWKLLVRMTSGNQFGLDENEIRELIRNRESYKEVVFQGLQFYSGTQKKRMKKLQKELDHLDEFIEELKTESGYEAKHLEYGPGLFTAYFQQEEPVDDAAMLDELAKMLKSMRFYERGGKLTLEMGRYMTAECGYFLTSIVDQKVNHGQNYCIVDGGIHHMNYYGQSMAMKIPYYQELTQKADQEEQQWNICGSLCTISDMLVKQLPLHKPAIGDVLVFERLGAYSVTEGIGLFLSRDLPRVVFYSKKEGFSLQRDITPTNVLNSGV